jgi:hypothetical protein
VLALAPMAHAAATETAAKERISRLEEALRSLTFSPQARRPSAAGPARQDRAPCEALSSPAPWGKPDPPRLLFLLCCMEGTGNWSR